MRTDLWPVCIPQTTWKRQNIVVLGQPGAKAALAYKTARLDFSRDNGKHINQCNNGVGLSEDTRGEGFPVLTIAWDRNALTEKAKSDRAKPMQASRPQRPMFNPS